MKEKIGKKKILIIDDEYAIRELVEFTLEDDYDILKAENADSAFKIISSNKPDLIILDIMMPRIDGYDVCKKLKEDKNTKDIPVIMLTAKHSMDDLNKAIKCDVDEFITKPFEPELLKQRIDCYLLKECNTKKKLFHSENAIHYIKEQKKY
ncbi:MAG: response regulator [Nanoarchaeota archaeon]